MFYSSSYYEVRAEFKMFIMQFDISNQKQGSKFMCSMILHDALPIYVKVNAASSYYTFGNIIHDVSIVGDWIFGSNNKNHLHS